MIIDFHTHCFSDEIAERAMDKLSSSACLHPQYDGTTKGLAAVMARDSIDLAIVQCIATKPSQQTVVNNYASKLHGKLRGFGSVHPDAPNALEELERIASLGLKGVKFHPEYQDFFVDEERMLPIYEKIASLGLITLFHAGLDLSFYSPTRATPERFARILPSFGGAPVVAAHWGGFQCWNDVEKHLVGRDVFLDTSFACTHMRPKQAQAIANAHGAHKILFGSDAPWSSPADEIAFVRALELSPEDERKIFCENAIKLLGLSL